MEPLEFAGANHESTLPQLPNTSYAEFGHHDSRMATEN